VITYHYTGGTDPPDRRRTPMKRCSKCGTPEGANLGACSFGGYCRFTRAPKDTTGAALVPGTVYRVRGTWPQALATFYVYRDAVVEDDDSITLVVEEAGGRRIGFAAASYTVEPITTPSYADEPTLQRAADGDR
jgi:hypothetical protein